MDCPACGTPNSRVLDTFKSVEDRRKRACVCGARWDTTETVDKGSLRVATGVDQSPPVSTNGISGNRLRRVTPNPDGSQPLASGGVGGGLSSDPIRIPDPNPVVSDPPNRARVWAPADWLREFGKAWSQAFCKGARHYGNTSDAKACGELEALIAALPQTDVLAAQERAQAMFAEFFAERTGDLVKARHCFAFFVTRWGQLRVPALPAAAPTKPWIVPDPPRADPNCRDWHANGKNTGKRNPRGEQPGCPECKSVYLRSWTAEDRPGEPESAADVLRQGGQKR